MHAFALVQFDLGKMRDWYWPPAGLGKIRDPQSAFEKEKAAAKADSNSH